jgi:hypothetical protein
MKRERALDRGRRFAAADRRSVGSEIRASRLVTGRTVDSIAAECNISPAQVRRIERGALASVKVEQLAVLGSAVGLDVRVRAYPGPDPLLDAAQVRLLGRLRARLHHDLTVRLEVGLPIQGDQRAWDVVLDGFSGSPPDSHLPVEAESRLIDLQAQTRRILLKLRDSPFSSVLVVVADTRSNREALDMAAGLIAADFPVSARTVWKALAAGQHPGGSAIVLL